MNKILLLLTISILFSCNSDDCDPEVFRYRWEDLKEITVTTDTSSQTNQYQIGDGQNIVFTYTHDGRQCDDIFDDEWTEVIQFEVDKDVTDFEYVDSNIARAKCHYREIGAWTHGIPQEVKSGTIKGKKLNSSEWEISLSIKTTPQMAPDTSKTIKFFQNFTQ